MTRPPYGAAHFHRQVAADARQLVTLRAELARWLAGLTPPWTDIRREDIILASYEALANSAEHAYHGQPAGDIVLEATHQAGRLTIIVRDTGSWKPATRDDPFRGRGLLMIQTLAEHNAVVREARGTEVTMNWSNEAHTQPR